MTNLGEPQRFWHEAESADVTPRDPAPDITEFGDFVGRVVMRGPSWRVPLILAAVAVLFLVFAVAGAGTDLFETSVETGWIVLLVLAVVFAAAAVAVYVWDRSTRVRSYWRSYSAYLECGVPVEGFLTGLDLASRDHGERAADWAWVLVDIRESDQHAARLRVAFATWLAAVEADGELYRDVKHRVRARQLLPSEEIFGDDVVGGYLGHADGDGRWKVLLPRKPSNPSPLSRGWAWRAYSVRGDTDVREMAVHIDSGHGER
ncbi:hypothetical protein ACFQ3B_24065 [Stackebrandtia endophytica]|nr:hypothetical protein [Stackebrandtia endophytica]